MANNFIVKWKHEIAYGVMALFVVIALVGYQRHNDKQLSHADRISCIQRKLLLENQRFVLSVLAQNNDRLRYLAATPLLVELALRINRIDLAPPCV